MYRAVTDAVPFRHEVARHLEAAGDAHLRELLTSGVQRGEVDPSVDLELATFVLRRLMTDLQALILRRLGITLEAAAADVTLVSGPTADQLYDQVVQILQHGLGTRAGTAPGVGDAP
jgi:hypothetical protein